MNAPKDINGFWNDMWEFSYCKGEAYLTIRQQSGARQIEFFNQKQIKSLVKFLQKGLSEVSSTDNQDE